MCVYYRYVHIFTADLVFSTDVFTIFFSIGLCVYISACTVHMSVHCVSSFEYVLVCLL